ncbi:MULTISPECIES: hypothetical protein [Halorussus]|nr:hypothetical protein [Halorussus vallis]USZ77217.1 hypothetical protein NGM07_07765 [Halorussus vallis]
MPNKYGYTTINVYPDDRDTAKRAKYGDESWSDFLRRAGKALDSDAPE